MCRLRMHRRRRENDVCCLGCLGSVWLVYPLVGSEEAGALEGLWGVGGWGWWVGYMRDFHFGFRCTLHCIHKGSNTVSGIREALVMVKLHGGAASEDNNVALRYC